MHYKILDLASSYLSFCLTPRWWRDAQGKRQRMMMRSCARGFSVHLVTKSQWVVMVWWLERMAFSFLVVLRRRMIGNSSSLMVRVDDQSISRMREMLFWMNEQMRRRLAFPQVTCCFGLPVALEDAFPLVTMKIKMLHHTLAKTSSQFAYLCTYNVRSPPHTDRRGWKMVKVSCGPPRSWRTRPKLQLPPS